MSGSALDVTAFKNFNHQQLIQLFSLDSHVQTDSGIPGVTMSKPVRPCPLVASQYWPNKSACTLQQAVRVFPDT
jgi:hypothetical protein